MNIIKKISFSMVFGVNIIAYLTAIPNPDAHKIAKIARVQNLSDNPVVLYCRKDRGERVVGEAVVVAPGCTQTTDFVFNPPERMSDRGSKCTSDEWLDISLLHGTTVSREGSIFIATALGEADSSISYPIDSIALWENKFILMSLELRGYFRLHPWENKGFKLFRHRDIEAIVSRANQEFKLIIDRDNSLYLDEVVVVPDGRSESES